MPRTRPLNTDNFTAQSVAPDFGDDAGRGTAYRRVFLGKNIHTFMPAPLTARRAPSVVKTLAFNGIRQALLGRRLLRPQLFDFGTGARKLLVVQPANKTTAALINKVLSAVSASNQSPCCVQTAFLKSPPKQTTVMGLMADVP